MMTSQRGRIGVLVFIFTIAGSIVIWAGILTAQSEADKFLLEFCPAKGSNLIYYINSTTKMTALKDFFGRDVSLDASAVGEIYVDIKGVVPEHTLTSLTTPGIHIDVQFPDNRTQFDISTTGTEPVQAIFSRRGMVDMIQNIENLNRQNKLNVSLEQIVKDFFPAFPRRTIAIGETWIESKQLVIPFQGINLQVLIDETYFLDGVFHSFEGQIANISVDYRVRLMGSKSLGNSIGSFEGQGRGSGMLRVKIDGGYFTEFRIDHKTEGYFIIKDRNTELFRWPFHLTVTVAIILIGKY
jgi:hypothetical protein